MKTAHIILSLSFLALLVTGCGTKRQYFEPESVAGKVSYDGSLPSSIVDVTREGATLANGQMITKKGITSIALPEGKVYLAEHKERYVGASECGEVVVIDAKGSVIFKEKMSGPVASAALKGDLLALVLGSNELVLIGIDSGKHHLRMKQDSVLVLDSRIASPYFLGDLIVFPTLDGKLVIVDEKSKRVIRDIVISHEKFFGNVHYLSVLGDRLVAATKSKVVSINPKSMAFLEADIKDVIVLENRIFVFTKDGKVIATDSDLKVLKERKFPFATFAGTLYGKYLYMVEKGGYLMVSDLDLDSVKVYKLPNSIEEHLFAGSNKLYYKNSYYTLTAH